MSLYFIPCFVFGAADAETMMVSLKEARKYLALFYPEFDL